eukprot:1105465-Lingulodinium_polyedra.AAC.1
MAELVERKLVALKGAGCEVLHCIQQKREIMFVFGGWLTAEAVVDGVLVHGSRSTALWVDGGTAADYEAFIG